MDSLLLGRFYLPITIFISDTLQISVKHLNVNIAVKLYFFLLYHVVYLCTKYVLCSSIIDIELDLDDSDKICFGYPE